MCAVFVYCIGLAGRADVPLNSVLLRNVMLCMDVSKGGDLYFRVNVDAFTPQFGESGLPKARMCSRSAIMCKYALLG